MTRGRSPTSCSVAYVKSRMHCTALPSDIAEAVMVPVSRPQSRSTCSRCPLIWHLSYHYASNCFRRWYVIDPCRQIDDFVVGLTSQICISFLNSCRKNIVFFRSSKSRNRPKLFKKRNYWVFEPMFTINIQAWNANRFRHWWKTNVIYHTRIFITKWFRSVNKANIVWSHVRERDFEQPTSHGGLMATIASCMQYFSVQHSVSDKIPAVATAQGLLRVAEAIVREQWTLVTQNCRL